MTASDGHSDVRLKSWRAVFGLVLLLAVLRQMAVSSLSTVRPGVPPSGSAGCAPRPVPGRGHAASIPDASGRGQAPGLRAALACLMPAGVVGLAC